MKRRRHSLLFLEEALAQGFGEKVHNGVIGQEKVECIAQLPLCLKRLVFRLELRDPNNLLLGKPGQITLPIEALSQQRGTCLAD